MIFISVTMKDNQDELLRKVDLLLSDCKKLKERLDYLDILIKSTLLIGKGGFAD